MARARGGRKTPESKKRSAARWRRLLVLAGLLAAAFAVGWLMWPFWQFSGRFTDLQAEQPSRLYARPTLVLAGERVALDRLVAELADLGYESVAGAPSGPGEFERGSR